MNEYLLYIAKTFKNSGSLNQADAKQVIQWHLKRLIDFLLIKLQRISWFPRLHLSGSVEMSSLWLRLRSINPPCLHRQEMLFWAWLSSFQQFRCLRRLKVMPVWRTAPYKLLPEIR